MTTLFEHLAQNIKSKNNLLNKFPAELVMCSIIRRLQSFQQISLIEIHENDWTSETHEFHQNLKKCKK